MRDLEFLQLEPDLTPDKLKHVHSIIMQQEKHVLIEKYRKTQAFAEFKKFALASAIEMLVINALCRYYSSDDNPISAVTKLFADLISIHPFEDGNGRLSQVILSHVLMQSGCSFVPHTLKLLSQAR